MKSSKYRHFLELQEYDDDQSVELGEDTWVKVTDLFCEVTTTSGSESLGTEGYADTSWTVKTRYCSTLTTPNTKQRLIYGSRELYIEAVLPDPTGQRELTIQCNEIQP